MAEHRHAGAAATCGRMASKPLEAAAYVRTTKEAARTGETKQAAQYAEQALSFYAELRRLPISVRLRGRRALRRPRTRRGALATPGLRRAIVRISRLGPPGAVAPSRSVTPPQERLLDSMAQSF
jgi:hypothetical protein